MKRAGLALLILIALVAAGLALWEPMAAGRAGQAPAGAYQATIVRDAFGVPHIFGRRDADVSYGLAYAHAEDDFATIQEVLAMPRSRLGAITGEEGAKIDYVAHLLDVQGTVVRDYGSIPADVRALLDGYAAGLNRYADKHPGEVRLKGLFPATGRDIAAGFVLRSPFFFGLEATLGALTAGETLPAESAAPMVAGELAGSNAFAIAPSRSADGATRLVSNSHQPWEGGVAWYEAAVHSGEGWHFAGALFPGSPYPLLGHNRTLGWTNTVNRPDLIDVYKLALDESGTRYRFDGRWLPLETRRVTLRVRMGPVVLPVPRDVHRSVHGPVIVNDEGAFAIRFAGIDQLKMLEQYFRLNKARDFAEWQAAMAIGGIPATNFIYADAAGNIGLFYNALFPARKPGFDYRTVLPGDTSAALWRGAVGWERVPRLINPASGYVMNSNNTPFLAAGPGDELNPASFSPLLGIERDVTNRAVRAIELLEADEAITEAELEAIKFDTGYSRASYAGPWMASIAALKLDNAPLREAQALLGGWDWTLDGKGAADSLALLVLQPANRTNYRRQPFADPREELAKAAEHLRTHFGRLDPPLGALLRLRRGSVDLPLDGGPDVLRAMARWDVEADGRLKVKHGDSYMQFVSWDRDGRVRSKSINQYGAATTRPRSPHYADQARLFVEHRFKPVHFDPQELRRHAKRVYRP